MSLDHRDDLRDRFAARVALFNQICFNRIEALPDVWEEVPDWQTNQRQATAYAASVIDHICDAMPHFAKNMHAFLA